MLDFLWLHQHQPARREGSLDNAGLIWSQRESPILCTAAPDSQESLIDGNAWEDFIVLCRKELRSIPFPSTWRNYRSRSLQFKDRAGRLRGPRRGHQLDFFNLLSCLCLTYSFIIKGNRRAPSMTSSLLSHLVQYCLINKFWSKKRPCLLYYLN